MRRLLTSSALAMIGAVGCSSTGETPRPPSASGSASTPVPPASSAAAAKHATLAVLPSDFDFSRNPDAARRVAESPHHYYRFINGPFSDVVCDRYANLAKGAPAVELHGDAHLEQYTVGSRGRGLSDLDRHARGPAVMDLLRMSTSIAVAVTEKADDAVFPDAAPKGIAALFRGYRAALDDPDKRLEAPPIVARIARTKNDRKALLAFADRAMKPVPEGAPKVHGQELYSAFQSDMIQRKVTGAKKAELPASFFTMEKIGTIELGIGSALDERFLLRLEGRTSNDDDDVIVELKPIRTPSASCLSRSADFAETRFMFTEQSSGPSFEPGPIPGTDYWSLEWSDDHHELRIDRTLEKTEDLETIAFESGFLLARGHLFSVSTAADRASTRATLVPSAALEKEVAAASVALAGETKQAWADFKAAVVPP